MCGEIVRIIRNDGRTVEVDMKFGNNQPMRHYMTIESYKLHMLIDELQNIYGISDKHINELVYAVQNDAQRNDAQRNDDEEECEW